MSGQIPIIDISVPLHPGTPRWPGSAQIRIQWVKRIESGDNANVSSLECDVHAGTHIDAPLHFLKDGRPIEAISKTLLIGPAVVVHLPDALQITARKLDNMRIPPNTERLLLRTRNSDFWASDVTEFRKDYTALTSDAAQWIVDRGIKLIGIDYLSIQMFNDPTDQTHKILLGGDVVILEGLILTGVEPKEYELICLPIRIEGTEGAPARAVLREMRPSEKAP